LGHMSDLSWNTPFSWLCVLSISDQLNLVQYPGEQMSQILYLSVSSLALPLQQGYACKHHRPDFISWEFEDQRLQFSIR
jgi:hypothetical protein